jgi:uncharacterized protein (TIGR03067 family)
MPSVTPPLIFLARLLLVASASAGAEGPTDLDKLQGHWKVVSIDNGTKPFDPRAAAGDENRELQFTVKVEGQTFSIPWFDVNQRESPMQPKRWQFTLDPRKSPREIDIFHATEKDIAQGIYALDGDSLKICLEFKMVGEGAWPRPKVMAADKDNNRFVVTLKRCREVDIRRITSKLANKRRARAAEQQLKKALDKYKQDPRSGQIAIRGVVDLYPETESAEEARRFLERIREWVDVSGRFSVDAEFRGIIGSQVRLLRISDGETITVPLSRLSEADQRWIESRRE